MDKPSDYMPEDVIKAAEKTVQSLEGINQYPIEWTLTIARAIKAARDEEREACARVADHLNGWGADFGKGGHAEHIAQAIRNLKHEG